MLNKHIKVMGMKLHHKQWILLKRSCIVFLFIFIILFSKADAQQLTDKAAIDLINEDFILLDRTCQNKISSVIYSPCEEISFFELIKKEKIDIKSTNKTCIFLYDLYAVDVKFRSWPFINLDYNLKNKIAEDTMRYYILFDNHKPQKLFGFNFCDINNAFSDKTCIDAFSEQLKTNGILTPKQTRLFKNAINNKSRSFPPKMGKPGNILRYYFGEKSDKASTIILPWVLFDCPNCPAD